MRPAASASHRQRAVWGSAPDGPFIQSTAAVPRPDAVSGDLGRIAPGHGTAVCDAHGLPDPEAACAVCMNQDGLMGFTVTDAQMAGADLQDNRTHGDGRRTRFHFESLHLFVWCSSLCIRPARVCRYLCFPREDGTMWLRQRLRAADCPPGPVTWSRRLRRVRAGRLSGGRRRRLFGPSGPRGTGRKGAFHVRRTDGS